MSLNIIIYPLVLDIYLITKLSHINGKAMRKYVCPVDICAFSKMHTHTHLHIFIYAFILLIFNVNSFDSLRYDAI